MFSSFGAFTEPQQQPIKKTTKIFNHTLLQFRTFLSPRVLDYRRGNCEINSKEERMKIQCNVCESAEATVLCCADEAALCHNCDEKVHAANKLASKHQRVSISHSSSQIPKCDICQDAAGYFFCLEDRALLCRKCDIAIHTANAFVSSHQRFLLTGVKVGLEAAAPGSSSSGGISHSAKKVSDAENQGTLKRSAPASTTSQHERESSIQRRVDVSMPSKRSLSKPVAHEFPKMQPAHGGAFEDITQTRMAIAGGSAAGTLSQWPIDDFLALNDFHLNYGFHDNGSSKADSGKLGESDSSLFMRSIEDDLDSDDRLGQVPDVSWTVPQVPSPPTASGLYWPKATQHLVDNAVFVPDICWNQASSYHQ